jgi:hypothetical protein
VITGITLNDKTISATGSTLTLRSDKAIINGNTWAVEIVSSSVIDLTGTPDGTPTLDAGTTLAGTPAPSIAFDDFPSSFQADILSGDLVLLLNSNKLAIRAAEYIKASGTDPVEDITFVTGLLNGTYQYDIQVAVTVTVDGV